MTTATKLNLKTLKNGARVRITYKGGRGYNKGGVISEDFAFVGDADYGTPVGAFFWFLNLGSGDRVLFGGRVDGDAIYADRGWEVTLVN